MLSYWLLCCVGGKQMAFKWSQTLVKLGISTGLVLCFSLSFLVLAADWQDLFSMGQQNYRQANYSQAEQDFLQALDAAQKSNAKPADIATIKHDLARLYRVESKFDKAEQLYNEAYKLFEEENGPQDPNL